MGISARDLGRLRNGWAWWQGKGFISWTSYIQWPLSSKNWKGVKFNYSEKHCFQKFYESVFVNQNKRNAIFLVKTSTAQVNKHFLMISFITYLTFRRSNDLYSWQVVRATNPAELPGWKVGGRSLPDSKIAKNNSKQGRRICSVKKRLVRWTFGAAGREELLVLHTKLPVWVQ